MRPHLDDVVRFRERKFPPQRRYFAGRQFDFRIVEIARLGHDLDLILCYCINIGVDFTALHLVGAHVVQIEIDSRPGRQSQGDSGREAVVRIGRLGTDEKALGKQFVHLEQNAEIVFSPGVPQVAVGLRSGNFITFRIVVGDEMVAPWPQGNFVAGNVEILRRFERLEVEKLAVIGRPHLKGPQV